MTAPMRDRERVLELEGAMRAYDQRHALRTLGDVLAELVSDAGDAQPIPPAVRALAFDVLRAVCRQLDADSEMPLGDVQAALDLTGAALECGWGVTLPSAAPSTGPGVSP